MAYERLAFAELFDEQKSRMDALHDAENASARALIIKHCNAAKFRL
jgi:hypothetical protein